MTRVLPLFATLAVIAGCREDLTALPKPVAMTEENVSFYCQMNVLAHGGPKAQVHQEGMPAPLFFAQVRDGMAFLKSPERDARILATYVSDMGAAASWSEPGASNWINVDEAIFVVEAEVAGGMGAPEIVPFADAARAEEFIARFGGRAVTLPEIPDDAVFGQVEPQHSLETPS